MSGHPDRPEGSSDTLHRLTAGEVPRAVDLLVRAFADDPFVTWSVRSDARRDEAMRRFFATCLQQLTMPFGEVWATDGIEGVAMWTPPGAFKLGLGAQVRFLWRGVKTFGLTKVPSRISGFNQIERHAPKTPYYYLFFMGIDPSSQGRGIGSMMLREMLARCDAEKRPAYLEATRGALIPFCRRHGYRTLEPLAVRHGGPTMLPMWRDPAG